MDNLLENAINLAYKKHKGQFRKGTNIPYIVHPIEVMKILKNNGASETEMIVGVLHDIIEDTNTSKKLIKNKFGKEVLNLLLFESENKLLSYKVRKQEHMDRIKNAPWSAKMVNCADKLSNISDMIMDYKTVGEKLFNRFNAGKEDVKWYYGLAIESLNELSGLKMYEELKTAYSQLFNI